MATPNEQEIVEQTAQVQLTILVNVTCDSSEEDDEVIVRAYSIREWNEWEVMDWELQFDPKVISREKA